MIVDKINAYLSTEGKTIDEAILADVANLSRWAFAKQFGEREDKPGTLRLSSIGKCLRQQAYKLLNFESNGKAIDARARMVFFMGDLTELAVIALAKAAGCEIQSTGQNQLQVEIDGITGHPDGIIVENDVRYLLEVKSMSSFGFNEFQRGVLDEGYRYQNNSYMHALGLTQAIVVGLNKDAGVLHEAVISKDQAFVDEIKRRISVLKDVKVESLPERPYKPDAKGFLPWQCRYCAYYGTCWPNSELALVGKAYKLKTQKETPHATPTPA